ncbi:hypothetical protein [Ideonella sp. B508-1]|uniref:hypothetical protein n=1 Tax=Ideonella sp. B508-1 TaxID=137716 RepID=UPI00131EF1FC|nr:hypothetical protein [Ideonella sp. B508-1]
MRAFIFAQFLGHRLLVECVFSLERSHVVHVFDGSPRVSVVRRIELDKTPFHIAPLKL